MTTETTLPALPHWDSPPADPPAAVRELKAAVRRRLRAAGRDIEEVAGVVEAAVAREVEDIVATRDRGEEVWPVVDYADIEAGTVPPAVADAVARRGCLVVRGHFERGQALDWDAGIRSYVEGNRFFEDYRGPGDDFFGTLDAKPEIYPVYWSRTQMEARQSPRMAAVQSWLNRRWAWESEDGDWFDPDRGCLYPDRIRRRPPGTTSKGLGAHFDTGTLDLWMMAANQRAFGHLFDGTVEDFDPWDPAHRTDGTSYPGSSACSAFRTFQGWTALSDMDRDQGVLHAVPIVGALAHLLLRPLLPDVPDDELCGVTLNRAFAVPRRWYPLLREALVPIPDVRAGDSVWWHCDMVHSVGAVADQRGWGNVMYIPAAPWCPRNERYAASVREALASGASPADFPAEDYERSWPDRFQVADLNQVGRRGLGLDAA